MVFKQFIYQIFARFGVLLATLAFLAWLLANTENYATALLFTLLATIQIVSLLHYIKRTNTDLSRFLNAIRFNDFSQSFSVERLGSSFEELNKAFDDIMARFREARSDKEQQARYLATLIEHVPVAMVSLYGNGRVELLNNASRKMFNVAKLADTNDLLQFGAAFQRDIMQAKAGETKLVQLDIDGDALQLMMSTTQITIGTQVQKLIALQNIQSQLDATELAAWQDLVRVVSHEIMNSITPVASLARSASELIDDLNPQDNKEDQSQAYEDVRDAIHTVARRSEGLMQFVRSYKQLTQMPPPKMKPFDVTPWFQEIEHLITNEWQGRPLKLSTKVSPGNLALAGDRAMLDQALINLLQNCAEALEEHGGGEVALDAFIARRGQVVIEIRDNGPGIDPEKLDKIFMPFFTTKPGGSGVGLALVRKIMLIHKGNASAANLEDGGAVFRLSF